MNKFAIYSAPRIHPSLLSGAVHTSTQLPGGGTAHSLTVGEPLDFEDTVTAMLLADVQVEVKDYWTELIVKLSKYPEDVYRLSARKYEELVATLLEKDGRKVVLTQQSVDGGFDILTEQTMDFGVLVTLYECKKWSPDRPIDVGIIRSFDSVVRNHNRAQVGVVCTTSRFSPAAQAWAQEVKTIYTNDYEHLKSWLSRIARLKG